MRLVGLVLLVGRAAALVPTHTCADYACLVAALGVDGAVIKLTADITTDVMPAEQGVPGSSCTAPCITTTGLALRTGLTATIFSDSGFRLIATPNAKRVMYVGGDLTLQNVLLTGGNFLGQVGGAIYVTGQTTSGGRILGPGRLSTVQVTFDGNAASYGGALYLGSGAIFSATDTHFTASNTALVSDNGHFIYVANVDHTISATCPGSPPPTAMTTDQCKNCADPSSTFNCPSGGVVAAPPSTPSLTQTCLSPQTGVTYATGCCADSRLFYALGEWVNAQWWVNSAERTRPCKCLIPKGSVPWVSEDLCSL